MTTKPNIELMKRNSWCNYLSCDWKYIGMEDGGIRLSSPDKHLGDIVVPYHRRHMIKIGKYQSFRK